MTSITLIISTYNWPEALDLVLKSVLAQTRIPNEIIIADDGSSSETKELVTSYISKFNCNLIHLWHADNGFRKSAILNKAIIKTSSDYIIQLDGDCILHPNFIKDHANFIEESVYLYGSRVNIQESYLPELYSSKNIRFSPFSKGIKKRTRAIHFPFFSSFFKKNIELSKKLRGCNLSYWKKDALAINGYNEDMEGWGREDSEFVLRLINHGVKGRRLRYIAIVYHIWHIEKSKDRLLANDKIQQETISQKIIQCKNGINNHLDSL